MEISRASRRRSKDKIEVSKDLLIIKDMISKPKRGFMEEEEFKKRLHLLGHKVEEIEKIMKEHRSNLDPKRKKEMIFLIENKEMNAEDIGRILKMSRNRANEYLNVMEREGILSSRFFGKKKYYSILKQNAR